MISIRVYGSGCATCSKLEQLCHEAVHELGLAADVRKVTDVREIAARGIMATPALEINGTIVSSGSIPAKPTLVRWIEQARTPDR